MDQPPLAGAPRLLDGCTSLIEQFYAQSHAAHWGLTQEAFSVCLQRGATKRFAGRTASPPQLRDYLSSLHLEDLALAAACAAGCESAWEHFFATYRGYMRSAAAAILRCPAASVAACELADSLFSDLYGLADGRPSERSLFRYFHGRSSLKTWLRAVLAQRHIDSLRAARRFAELPDEVSAPPPRTASFGGEFQPADPRREHYLSLFTRALQAALDHLSPSEKDRLRLYYADEKTLADIGRCLGEHESSVSRHLDRTRAGLRQAVEESLRRGFAAIDGAPPQPGLSDAEVALCFEYAAEDVPIDLDVLLPHPHSQSPGRAKRLS